MRIALLNDKFGKPGASSSIVKQTAEALEKRGHTVCIITSHRKEEHGDIRRDNNLISLPISYRIALRQYKSIRNAPVHAMLKQELEAFQPDIVHAHNIHTYLTYDALRVAKSIANGVYITMHDVMSFSYDRLRTQRFLDSGGKDCSLSMMNHISAAGLQYNPLRNRAIRSALSYADTVLPVSASLEHALHQHGISHTTVLHNALDMKEWNADQQKSDALRAKYHLNNRKVILLAGRISKDKGVFALLTALAELRKTVPEVLLLIAGKKDVWEACVQQSEAPSDIAQHYTCTGWLDHETMRSAFFASDVITTPSLCLDTFNMTNLEAMASAKPVVGTIFGGTPEVVQNDVTGYTCDPRDTALYVSYLVGLLNDPAKAKQMGQAGRTRAVEKFDLPVQISKLEELYAMQCKI